MNMATAEKLVLTMAKYVVFAPPVVCFALFVWLALRTVVCEDDLSQPPLTTDIANSPTN